MPAPIIPNTPPSAKKNKTSPTEYSVIIPIPTPLANPFVKYS